MLIFQNCCQLGRLHTLSVCNSHYSFLLCMMLPLCFWTLSMQPKVISYSHKDKERNRKTDRVVGFILLKYFSRGFIAVLCCLQPAFSSFRQWIEAVQASLRDSFFSGNSFLFNVVKWYLLYICFSFEYGECSLYFCFKTKHQIPPEKWEVIYGEYKSNLRLCFLPLDENTKCGYWFGFETEIQRTFPVFKAKTDI